MNAAAQGGLPVAPALFVLLFLAVFPLFWLAIIRVVAISWRKVEAAYPASSDPPYSARRFRWISMALGGPAMPTNYGSCINAWLSDSGLWLRPTLPFRAFHPMIYIPWTRIQSVEVIRQLWLKRARVKLGADLPDLLFVGAFGRAVLERWSGGEDQQRSGSPISRGSRDR